MSPLISWKVAEARTEELRRLEASTDVHPFARFVYLVFSPPTTRR
jgi:hypothetical protein